METHVYKKIYELQKSGWWFGNVRNRLIISLIKKLKLKNPRILDIGCSEGAFLDYLDKYGFDFKAIDIEEEAIEFCRERGYGNNVKFGSLLDIPFDKNSFDVVTALDIVEHVHDDKKAIYEINRVLDNKGYAIIIVPAFMWLWSANDEKYYHFRRYSMKEIIEKLEELYFFVEYRGYFNFFLFPVFVIMVLYAKIFPKKVKTSTTLKPVPGIINWMLKQILLLEAWIIRTGWHLPIGSSIIFIVKKNEYDL